MNPDVLANARQVATLLAESEQTVLIPGGSIWIWDPRDPEDAGGWQVYRPSRGFRLDIPPTPEVADRVRQEVEALLDAYPATIHQLTEMGCDHADIVHKEITTTDDADIWASSIWNACLPLVCSDFADIPGSFAIYHDDIQGQVAVVPGHGHTTRVVWSDSATYPPGTYLGRRHPVSLAAWQGQPVYVPRAR